MNFSHAPSARGQSHKPARGRFPLFARGRSPDRATPTRPITKAQVIATLTAFLTGTIATIVYLLTLAPDLTWAHFGADGGELITAAYTLGIPHPPGYPTYVMLGKLVSLLPLGTIAWRFNLFSALSIAIAAAFVTAVAMHTLPTTIKARSAAIATGLTFAFAPLVWGQATITEVYGLNLAFLAAFLWALLTKRPSRLTGLLLGLSLTTHLTSMFMLPLALALTPRTKWLKLVQGLLLGLIPLLLLPILAKGSSPVIWGLPDTLSGWWWLVSAKLYQTNLLPGDISAFSNGLQFWVNILLPQLAWFGWLFVLIGLVIAFKHAKWQTGWLLATAVIYAVYSLLYNTIDAGVYFLPGLLLLTILLAPALAKIGRWSLLLPLTLLLLNFNTHNLSRDHQVRPLAESTLQATPSEAILLTPGDRSIFSLWYMQHVEQQRPDIVLVDSNLFAFDWYRQRLQTNYPALLGLAKDDLAAFQALNAQQRPFCTVSLLEPTNHTCIEDNS